MCQKNTPAGENIRHWPLLYDLNIYRFQIQISIHTFELDVPKSTRVPENIRQWPLRKYHTMAFCYTV